MVKHEGDNIYASESATASTNMRKREGFAEVLFLSLKDTMPDLHHCLPAAGSCSALGQRTALSPAVCYILPKQQR